MISPVLKIENKGPDVAAKRLAVLIIQDERTWHLDPFSNVPHDFNYLTVARESLSRARDAFRVINKRRQVIRGLILDGAPVSDSLINWSMYPVTRYTKGKKWTP